jgi:polyisoprenyl-phosphate glycosyltransferase
MREIMKSVSAIIPAYNESERILNVLRVLKDVDFLEDIFVVDDGSKDNTVELVQTYQPNDPRIQIILHPNNLGKGEAIFSAYEKCTTPFILMLDADLIGMTPLHVYKLCQPVLDGKADMTLGIFQKGQLSTDFSHWITPWLSGQRCLRAELLNCVSSEAAKGYGIETALTVLSHQMHLKVIKIPWIGMSHPPGEIHRGSVRGLANRGKMYAQIVRAIVIASSQKREIKLRQSEKDFNQ